MRGAAALLNREPKVRKAQELLSKLQQATTMRVGLDAAIAALPSSPVGPSLASRREARAALDKLRSEAAEHEDKLVALILDLVG